jgi:CRP-like cAMP-binding protein
MDKRRVALQQALRLDDAAAKEALAGAEVRATAPDDVLVEQGEPSDAVFVIVRGRFEVDIEVEGAGVRAVRMLGPGRCFGELAVLDHEPRVATVTARTDGEVVVLRAAALEALLDRVPGARRALELEAAERRDQLSRAATH